MATDDKAGTGSANVVHPAHYNTSGFEVWDVLDAWFPNDPQKWNAGKYLARAEHKGSEIENLEKAKQYIDRRIAKLKAQQKAKVGIAGNPFGEDKGT